MRSALLASFGGLGNGAMIVPVLRAIDASPARFRYFHTSNLLLEDPQVMAWAALEGFGGLVPSVWRRFEPEHWGAIEAWIAANGVDLVINLRNEDLAADRRYQGFKERNAGRLTFWDLTEVLGSTPTATWCESGAALLRRHGVDVPDFDPAWMRPHVPHGWTGTIGLFVGASAEVKRWGAQAWVDLVRALLARTSADIHVLGGTTAFEDVLADQVAAAAGSDRVRPVTGLPFAGFVRHLASLRMLVANDSGPVHLAAALGLPCVGLYLATDARVWGSTSPLFRAVQSPYGLACPENKGVAGNCRRYDLGCPAPCKVGVSPEAVLDAVLGLYASQSASASNRSP